MPSNPPTVADLEAEVAGQCGVALADAGVYLRAVDQGGMPITPAIRQGMRDGALSVGLYLPNPLVLTDADVAVLSGWQIRRVKFEGMRFALRQAHQHWHRAVQKEGQPALAPAAMQGGWLMEEKRNIEKTISELNAICSQPYREPGDPIVVGNAHPGFPGVSDTFLTPDNSDGVDTTAGPYGPWGYGGWGYNGW